MLCLAALSASEVSGFPSLKGLSQARRLLSQERLPHARNQKPETPFRIMFEAAVGAGGRESEGGCICLKDLMQPPLPATMFAAV
jgi:hypothetical protein